MYCKIVAQNKLKKKLVVVHCTIMPRFDTPNGCFLNYVIYEPVLDQPTINVVLLHSYGWNLSEWQGMI